MLSKFLVIGMKCFHIQEKVNMIKKKKTIPSYTFPLPKVFAKYDNFSYEFLFKEGSCTIFLWANPT